MPPPKPLYIGFKTTLKRCPKIPNSKFSFFLSVNQSSFQKYDNRNSFNIQISIQWYIKL